ncbi:MAG: dTDP-4-dehydrorhamnose reductase [Gemmatimonadales bacterium]
MTERRILLLGANGQVGHELCRTLASVGQVISLGRAGADLSAPQSLRGIVREHRPQVIVNAAAHTAVDRAEGEPELAWTINAVAPGVLAEEARALSACLVHYSTDYVFDGQKKTPYDESDVPNPLSVYGRSKLASERAVAEACPRHLILRTSWVVGTHGDNFLKTILRLAAERDSLRVVADQYGAPTAAALIADVTARALQPLVHASERDARWGLYHMAARGETTWYGYARHVIGRARELGMVLKVAPDAVAPIPTADYPTPAKRPANSRLCTARLCATFAVELQDWRQGVDQVLEQLLLEQQP